LTTNINKIILKRYGMHSSVNQFYLFVMYEISCHVFFPE